MTVEELESKLYYYRAVVTRVVDGDSIRADIDYGFYGSLILQLRIIKEGFYFDTPESRKGKYVNDAHKAHGVKATIRAKELMPIGTQIYIRTKKADSFGRWLAEVWLPDGSNYAAVMISEGFQKKDDYSSI